ncbi:5-methylcytosine-specific restriction endonuclease system specificity protein McrC [Methanobrevibacter millerae]|nr:5-methylcytosine-specific restriction endonuclease system specificity protein McrC [Methanobrevibacter millerae]
MLSYAFYALNDDKYKKVETEEFENTADLFSEILAIGVSKQIKQGLVKDYIDVRETTSSIRGKIEITDSINSKSFLKKQLTCTYDEFSVNCYLNQILKSTMLVLLKSDISSHQKKKLKNILRYFTEVDLIDVNSINWKIRFDRNNQTYRMLIGVCYLTIKGLLQSEKSGETKLMQFIDDQLMNRLYEKFILNYYKKEHPSVKASASQINWQLDDGIDYLLPRMQSDIMLDYGDKVLIIDAKYYKNTTQSYYNTNTIHSGNLYQIFTYVKNKQLENNNWEVSGMLLYARTDEEILPNNSYQMSGNTISVKTLDLNQDFTLIKEQLDKIVDDYF